MNILDLKAGCLTATPLPHTQPSPSIRRGYGFEEKVGDFLEAWADALGFAFIDHPWLQDSLGGWNQPDFLWVASSQAAVLFEVKLTWTPDALCQLTRYSGLLQYPQITKVVVCKNVTPASQNIIHHPLEIADLTTLHLPLTLPLP